MICPRCGSGDLQTVSEFESTTDVKGYGCCKGLIGYLILGPIGWICGLCGMGEGRTRTRTTTLWMCKGCGNKFR